jgi:hypothetical protein
MSSKKKKSVGGGGASATGGRSTTSANEFMTNQANLLRHLRDDEAFSKSPLDYIRTLLSLVQLRNTDAPAEVAAAGGKGAESMTSPASASAPGMGVDDAKLSAFSAWLRSHGVTSYDGETRHR